MEPGKTTSTNKEPIFRHNENNWIKLEFNTIRHHETLGGQMPYQYAHEQAKIYHLQLVQNSGC